MLCESHNFRGFYEIDDVYELMNEVRTVMYVMYGVVSLSLVLNILMMHEMLKNGENINKVYKVMSNVYNMVCYYGDDITSEIYDFKQVFYDKINHLKQVLTNEIKKEKHIKSLSLHIFSEPEEELDENNEEETRTDQKSDNNSDNSDQIVPVFPTVDDHITFNTTTKQQETQTNNSDQGDDESVKSSYEIIEEKS